MLMDASSDSIQRTILKTYEMAFIYSDNAVPWIIGRDPLIRNAADPVNPAHSDPEEHLWP